MRRTLSWSRSQDSTPGILHWILALITSYGPKWSQYRLKWAKPKQSPTIRNKRCALRFFAAKFYEIQCKTRLIWMKCQPTSYDWKNPYFHLFSGCMFWDEMFSPCLQLSISKATFSEAPLESDCVSKNSGEPTILHNSNSSPFIWEPNIRPRSAKNPRLDRLDLHKTFFDYGMDSLPWTGNGMCPTSFLWDK